MQLALSEAEGAPLRIYFVILSDERSEKSKEPYTAHSLSYRSLLMSVDSSGE